MPKSRPFILSPHRPKSAAPSPPSPFRLRIVPGEGAPRTLECPRRVQVLTGAMRHATSYAADCGISGQVEVLELMDGTWTATRVLDVKSSSPAGWRQP